MYMGAVLPYHEAVKQCNVSIHIYTYMVLLGPSDIEQKSLNCIAL